MAKDKKSGFVCGVDIPTGSSLKDCITATSEYGFSFMCIPLAHPSNSRTLPNDESDMKRAAWTRTDLVLNCNDWNCLVVAKISDWLDLDSANPHFKMRCQKIFSQEIQFASHLGLSAVMVKLHGTNHVNLARFINSYTSNKLLMYQHQFWLQVPLTSHKANAWYFRSDVDEEEEIAEDTWQWWNKLRLTCDSNQRVCVALELTADLPPPGVLTRWLGEPVKVVMVPTSVFVTNKRGYPVLPVAHQTFLKQCMKVFMKLCLTGACRHQSMKHYLQYLGHLYQEVDPARTGNPYCRGFEDHLQIPLQPLMDNLEANTYEVFEKDPVKYTEYQNAIYSALLDRVKDEDAKDVVQVVMVVGAGRGPLVTATLAAARNANRRVKVYAVEKNPNAIITLADLKRESWGDSVEIVHCDMRKWAPEEKCDILVSELLGSFGDNELSPECLDGAQSFLKDDGVSIPSEYTSYLGPIMTMKLYNEARASNCAGKPTISKYEMPYVVNLVSTYPIAPLQPLFNFVHPNRDPDATNERYKKLVFTAQEDSVLHGFSGYFDTVLYKSIKLSIVPETYSHGMFSWFPVYIPIKDPLPIKKGETLAVHFWRKFDDKNVWYEWSLTEPHVVPIHNPNGRSYTIGLF